MNQVDLTARYQSLSSRKRELENKQVELQTTLNYHRDEYNKLITELQSSFKVSSLQEAYSLRDSLQLKVSTLLDDLDKSLSEYESLLKDSGEPQ